MKVSTALRLKAIFDCLYFGIVPSFVYEKNCHYKGVSYWNHLMMNMRSIPAWVTMDGINEEDVKFVSLKHTYIRGR